MSQLFVNHRIFKPSESGELFLGRSVWSVRFRLPALGESEQAFLQGLERELVTICFDHPNLRLLVGRGRFVLDVIDLRRDITLLSLTGEGDLEQVSAWPEVLPVDMPVAHEVSLLKLETEVAATACGLCPPGVNVEIRRTERVKGLEPGKLIIQMSVGGAPW